MTRSSSCSHILIPKGKISIGSFIRDLAGGGWIIVRSESGKTDMSNN
jgi:hypothetical protein